jgi:Cu/Ag efflux pump CusA
VGQAIVFCGLPGSSTVRRRQTTIVCATPGTGRRVLYTMFHSFKWATLILANVAMARIGGLLALLVTHTNFSVSSGVGFLALFGVSVQTGVIMLEYMNQLRARGRTIEDSAIEGAVLRLRPIMMTMLVATPGLLPAALSHVIGSDSQRPFAIAVAGGPIADLVMIAMCCRGRSWMRKFENRTGQPWPRSILHGGWVLG